jgi:hypothetical protein
MLIHTRPSVIAGYSPALYKFVRTWTSTCATAGAAQVLQPCTTVHRTGKPRNLTPSAFLFPASFLRPIRHRTQGLTSTNTAQGRAACPHATSPAAMCRDCLACLAMISRQPSSLRICTQHYELSHAQQHMQFSAALPRFESSVFAPILKSAVAVPRSTHPGSWYTPRTHRHWGTPSGQGLA